jgi:hypothetical protein
MPPLELMPEMQEVDLERFEGIKRFLLYLADRPSSWWRRCKRLILNALKDLAWNSITVEGLPGSGYEPCLLFDITTQSAAKWNRVMAYRKLLMQMRILGDFRRFFSGKNATKIFAVVKWRCRPLLLLAKRFQANVVRSWNSTVDDLTVLFHSSNVSDPFWAQAV